MEPFADLKRSGLKPTLPRLKIEARLRVVASNLGFELDDYVVTAYGARPA